MTEAKLTRPIVLTVAGSDPSGGAGIQADLKTFAANGVYGASVITALTAQNTLGVQGVHIPPTEFIDQQLQSVLTDLSVAAIKTGMLANQDIIETVLTQLNAYPSIPVVADPVMVATSGDPLLSPDAVAAVRQHLLPRATLITPNLDEAAQMLQVPRAATQDEMVTQARNLVEQGCSGVLLKGGHFDGDTADDVLATSDGAIQWFTATRVATENTHGTGCTLSAAIAAHLARGQDLVSATAAAKSYLTKALQAGAAQAIGQGHGPVDHIVS